MNQLPINYSNLKNCLQVFWPYSAGSENQLLELALQGVKSFSPTISAIIEEPILPVLIEDLNYPSEKADRLKILFDAYGSDKAKSNEYHKFYSIVFEQPIENIFEIGLGSNNTSVASNMGQAGRPGASLRSFRDFADNINVFGADVDKGILFSDTRIQTRFVNQLDPDSFTELIDWLPPLDLFIDDGLHSFPANLNSLIFGLKVVKPGGWIIIEDINPITFPLWQVVAELITADESYIVKAGTGSLFAIKKKTGATNEPSSN